MTTTILENHELAIKEKFRKEILHFLPLNIRNLLDKLSPNQIDKIEEIRFRKNKAMVVRLAHTELYISEAGAITAEIESAYRVQEIDLSRILQLISQASLYTLEEELRNGYLTLPGGHRIGFVGESVLENGKLKTLKNISSLNIRFSRQLLGCADHIMPYLINEEEERVFHTLIISPPKCGKTTLLRDIVRQLSRGLSKELFFNVGLVDERSEIAGAYLGSPQNDVGPRTDVLDGCPKAEGMIMLLRSMSPDIIVTDELGKMEDILALEEMLKAGITVISTIHGSNYEEVGRKPLLQKLFQQQIFERIIILSKKLGTGTIEAIIDLEHNNLLTQPLKPYRGASNVENSWCKFNNYSL